MAKASTARTGSRPRVSSIRNKGQGTPIRMSARDLKARHAIAQRMSDHLLEALSGIGTDKDKLTQSSFVFTEFDQQQANNAYRSDWVARKIVDIPAYDATREWRTWQADSKDITLLEDEEERLGLQRKTWHTLTKARLYGGAALVMGINQGRNEDPVDPTKINKGDLQFIHAVSRYELTEGELDYDLASPWYGEPKYYERHTPGSMSVKFHPSRVVPFVGAAREDGFEAKTVWGDSVLQIVMDAVKASALVSHAGAQLLAEAKIDVIKVPGLSMNIGTTAYEDKLKARFAIANLVKSIYSMLLIDKEEDWNRQAASFTGIPDMLNMYMLMACGAADIPATRFLGQSPAGMNATGESDVRNYYDSTTSKQKLEVSPRIKRVDEILLPSTFGTTPDEVFYSWTPLWQLSDKEKAETWVQKANVMKADVDAQLIEPMVLKQARQNQLIEDQTYPGLEAIIDEFDADNVDPAENEAEIDPITGLPVDPAAALDPANENEPEPAVPPRRQAARDARGRPLQRHRAGSFASMRQRMNDATPRTAYVSRKVLNSSAIRAWAVSQGFTSMLEDDDLHVTVAFSRTPFDWTKAGEGWQQNEDGSIRIKPGGPRVMEQFNNAQVLVFSSTDLAWRHGDILRVGGTWDYEDYQPHITITYRGSPTKLRDVVPYAGEIILGPEVWKEINTQGMSDPEEQVLDAVHYNTDHVPATYSQDLADFIAKAVREELEHHEVNVTVDAKGNGKGKRVRKQTTKMHHDDKGRISHTETVIEEGEDE